jgi:hypothetical protein
MRKTDLLVILASTLAISPAVAEQSPSGARPLAVTPDDTREVVRAVIKTVQDDYVFPDRTPAIIKRLEQSLSSGRYSTSTRWSWPTG